jgi:hypothetical protein
MKTQRGAPVHCRTGVGSPSNFSVGAFVDLEITPESTKVGTVVRLASAGLAESRFHGGCLSLFQRHASDGRWETIYRLFSPYGGRNKPWYEELSYPSFVHAIGITGAVYVVIPPVESGTYRIERALVAPQEGPGPHRLVLHGLVTVT